ncbi:GTP cyclohydrolase II [Sphingomicrobium flavum]|uniref:GTP cyclohydrolase II n=1 Tax=Sphingomicrobium flavum TaxID=1229164 RepID=UPI0021AD5D2E|nr:GTP cyclohydrolase II [Sphingomicrobium flavum]
MSEASVPDAVKALQRGLAVRIDGGPAILPLETGRPEQPASLLMSGGRAAALGLGNRREACDAAKPVRVAATDWLTVGAARELIDPAHDFARGPLGPLSPVEGDAHDALAIKLLTLAGLLPAAWVVDQADVRVSPAAIEAARREVSLVARARLPLDDLPPSQMAVFRDGANGEEHAALIIGAFGGQPPLVRLHSECLTGDVFGSLKCDCGPQLKQALKIIGDAGGGILLYLRQEGRGIGLANKLRAYALQDRGLDTVDANRRLGFADDERDYGAAAAMLKALAAHQVRLLTNNPNKVAGLEAEGVTVTERVRHQMMPNPHNAHYLDTKKARSGHLD